MTIEAGNPLTRSEIRKTEHAEEASDFGEFPVDESIDQIAEAVGITPEIKIGNRPLSQLASVQTTQ